MGVVFAVLGAGLGLILGGGFWEALVGGGIGWLLGQLESLKAVLARQEQRLRRVENKTADRQRSPERSDAAQVTGAAEAPASEGTEPPVAAGPQVAPPREPWSPPDVPTPRQPWVPPEAPASTAERRQPWAPPAESQAGRAGEQAGITWDRPDLVLDAVVNFFTTGNIMARVGIVILFFGVAFLVKYAADHALFPLELRLLGVFAGGLAMLATGWRLRQRRRNYGLALQGGGIGVLFLTIYAAYRLYGLIPSGITFAGLVLIAVGSALLAVRQNALALAVLGAIGGFLAPALASTGQGSHVALFSYYLVLNLSIFVVAWFKAWRILNLVGFVFTFGIGSLWGYRYYAPEYFASTEPFLLIFFALYTTIPVLFAFHQPPKLKGHIDGTLVFGTPIIVFALQAALVSDWRYGLAYSALGFGVYYLALAWLLFRFTTAAHRPLAEAFLANGVVLVTLAVPFAWEARPTSALWALEGVGIVWVGARERRALARWFGVALQGLAGLVLMASVPMRFDGPVLIDEYYLGSVILVVAALLSAFFLRRARDSVSESERLWVVNGLLLYGLMWWLAGGVSQVTHVLPEAADAGGALAFLAFTVALATFAASRMSWTTLLYPAVGFLPVLWLMFLYMWSELGHAFASFGHIAWPIALGVQLWSLRRLEEKAGLDYAGLHPPLLWLVTGIITVETGWAVAHWLSWADTWEITAAGLVPSAVVLLVSKYAPRLPWPFDLHVKHYLSWGLVPVAGLAFAGLLVINLMGPGDPAPLRYLPLLNPVDVCSVFALLALAHMVRTAATTTEPAWMAHFAHRGHWWVAGAAFLWINAALLRTLHFWAGVPFTMDAMANSQLVQTAVTILWASLAVGAMLMGSRYTRRAIWFTGTALMAVVVVKLFAVDLSGTQTIARIVAFLVVGLLLLVVGYFSPVPPRVSRDSTI